jgi:hypothetical protein
MTGIEQAAKNAGSESRGLFFIVPVAFRQKIYVLVPALIALIIVKMRFVYAI